MPVTSHEAMRYVETSSQAQIEQDLRKGEHLEELRIVFGDAMVEEMRQMANQRMAVLGERPPVVLLPGIMGSTLYDESRGWIWMNPLAMIDGLLPRIALSPHTMLNTGASVKAKDLIPVLYLPMRIHLKFWGGCTVEAFPYDWRQVPSAAADDLRLTVRRLFEQEQHKVLLVGHSMGGLVARDYCLKYPAEAAHMVERIVMLGTPNYGSFNAVRALTLGDDGALKKIQELNPDNDVLGVVRSLPGVYSLLPAPQDSFPQGSKAYPFDTSFDWYDRQAYRIDNVLTPLLQSTRAIYQKRSAAALPVPVTVIAGIDVPTAMGVTFHEDNGQLSWDFGSHVSNQGDGTVPLHSVTALPDAHCVYVRQGVHALLPWYANVRDAVKRIAHGEDAGLPTTIERGVLGEDEGQADTTAIPSIPSKAETPEVAERVRAGVATPGDLLSLVGLGL
jgi:pimeloyl-ACP methyl ester carboxylesterase